MRRVGKSSSTSSFGKLRSGNKVFLAIVGLCFLFTMLEAPNLLFRPPKLVVHHPEQQQQQQLKILQVQEEGDAAAAAKPASDAPRNSGEKAENRADGGTAPKPDIQHVADLAAAAGAEMWARVEAAAAATNSSGTAMSRRGAATGREEKCPQVVMFRGEELAAANNTLLLPCGLATGSSITIVARPRKAHVQPKPRIAMPSDDKDSALVSQFIVELRGLKMAAGEDPPRVLHLNPRLRGDWSSKPVIELNTCYRQSWGISQRCEGVRSPLHEHTVDGLPKCVNWVREEAGHNDSRPDDKNNSWWPVKNWMGSSGMGKAEQGNMNWMYPFAEERLFVLTIRGGFDGYHVTVDGRHIASFPYRGFVLEDATALVVDGDIDVRSVVATALPSSHSNSEQEVLEESEKYKAPQLKGPVHLFIGIMSASTHFAERMAVRKTWMQSSSILSSEVVARFFVGVHRDMEVNLRVKEEADYYKDIVILPFMDHYDLVVLKTIAICEFGVNISARHVMKTDDDTFVRVDFLSNLLKRKHKAPGVYIGNINQYHRPLREGKWAVTHEEWPEKEYPPYANGPGYIITSEIARFIVAHKKNRTLKLFKMEDVNMGMWVKQYNNVESVEYIHHLKFCQWGCVEDYYTAHYQSPRQMVCMWEKLQRGQAQCCNMR